ncbi:GNAT family N-acetyltransferase [Jatrophihabitans telluris]|uniref:GNAT family N-acetyltransferase n=1 Tax=Jatrophihabitans telluris TaxID=2038343 RepID=A0ABY4QXL3_9ACTN|nr:GNAT family N-acetyltransferase [Jatrophihabitans telluris]UQX87630.1 GNAT family N-acetyltransferase [Jatrophihabitans telluris]
MSRARECQPTLNGTNVIIRPWHIDDADAVYAACQDSAIQRWTTVPSPYGRSDAIDYVTSIAASAWMDGGGIFAIVVAATGRVAGSIGAHRMAAGVAHIGYWSVPDLRGNGFVTEALRIVTRWFLIERRGARVELVVEPANGASTRVAERAGFTFEGILRQWMDLRGRRIDVAMYSFIPTDIGGALRDSHS